MSGSRVTPQRFLQNALFSIGTQARNAITLLPGRRPRWIVLELGGSYPARVQRRLPFGLTLPPELGLSEEAVEDLAHKIDSLCDAPWLEGVVLRISDLRVDLCAAHALRTLIANLREAGKKTVAFTSYLDWSQYYVAAAADVVVAPECADVRLLGLAVSVLFLRDALSKIGVRFEKLAIGDYKSAFDTLVRQQMSSAQREQLDALLEDFVQQYVCAIAADRGLTKAVVRMLIDEGITSAAQAQRHRLIDRVCYEDELIEDDFMSYAEAVRYLTIRPVAPVPRIAVLTLSGTIVPGRSRRMTVALPGLGEALTGAESIGRCLRQIRSDDHTAAAVFYIQSGGGSALASDLIWREVKCLAERKPVVAVLGNIAASGGYYAAASATEIVAAPWTITGSIGVLTGKIVLQEFHERFGLHAERVTRGRLAAMFDSAKPFDEDERSWLSRTNEEAYARFIDRVAAGRRLERSRVDELGRGRIWSGVQAQRLGLVDHLGDVNSAIRRAAELAGLTGQVASYNARTPAELMLPTAADPSSWQRAVAPLLRESNLALWPLLVSLS